jgi:hypothetical protein
VKASYLFIAIGNVVFFYIVFALTERFSPGQVHTIIAAAFGVLSTYTWILARRMNALESKEDDQTSLESRKTQSVDKGNKAGRIE